MIKIAPSVLAADFGDLRNDVIEVEKAGADWLHIDIMDGHFVPNLSMGPDIVKSIREASGLFFDCHLMVENPEMFVEPFIKAGAELICFHAECVEDMDALIDKIHSYGVKAGVSVKPNTPAEAVFPYLEKDREVAKTYRLQKSRLHRFCFGAAFSLLQRGFSAVFPLSGGPAC